MDKCEYYLTIYYCGELYFRPTLTLYILVNTEIQVDIKDVP